MATREEVMGVVDRVASLRERYEEIGEESAAVNREHWKALDEAHWDRRADAVRASDSEVADINAASAEAFGELGRALVEMHSLALAAERGAAIDAAASVEGPGMGGGKRKIAVDEATASAEGPVPAPRPAAVPHPEPAGPTSQEYVIRTRRRV